MIEVLLVLLAAALVVLVVRALRRPGSSHPGGAAGKLAADQAHIARQGQSGLGGGLGPM